MRSSQKNYQPMRITEANAVVSRREDDRRAKPMRSSKKKLLTNENYQNKFCGKQELG
jgi:hypothetical protein